MNRLRIFIAFLLSIMIQTAIIPNFKIFGAYANMSIAVVIAIAINYGSYASGYSGIVLGLIEDMLFSQVIGVKALIYYIIGFVVGYNEESINKGDIRSGSILTILATIFYWIANTVMYMFIGNVSEYNIEHYFKGGIFVEIILNVILYIICHYIIKKIFKNKRFRF